MGRVIPRRALLAAAPALLTLGCARSAPAPLSPDATEPPRLDPARHQVVTRTPASDLVVPADPDAVALSRAVLAAASAVVVADPERADAAASVARGLGLPLLLAAEGVAAELERLQTRTVVDFTAAGSFGAREVVPGPARAEEVTLPGLPARAQAPGVLVLSLGAPAPALAATLASAGLEAMVVAQAHPGASGATRDAVVAHTGPVVALGAAFGSDATLAAAVAATRTAPQFPGGGVVPLPDHRMIALYGHPESAALGMLGEQPPAAAVTRVQRLVSEYRRELPGQHVIGAFEVITTVASSSAGGDGDYSYETPVEKLLPWVEAAEAAGLYTVLDLQPGRTDFLTQAKRYEELLRRPWVGLALDPEWRLRPNEKHLVRVGQVGVDEVNAVGAWLADLVRDHRLPPKVLTLHQFQARMVTERQRLDTSRPEVQWLVHVDGQGSQPEKQATWGVLKRDLPAGVFLGWKNFEHEDRPMLTPAQTVAQVRPTPHFISYQ